MTSVRFLTLMLYVTLLPANHICFAGIEETYSTDSQREKIKPILRPIEANEVESLKPAATEYKNQKTITAAIKKLSITDFLRGEILIEGVNQNTLSVPDLNAAEYFSPDDFPNLKTSVSGYQQTFPNWLIDALQAQAKSLSIKPTTKTTPALIQEWKNDDWIYAEHRPVGNPSLDDLQPNPKAWAGPIVNDGVVRYQKLGDKTIARIYFIRSEYFSDMQQVAQGAWAFATHYNFPVSVSLDTAGLEMTNIDNNGYIRSLSLTLNLNVPIHVVTPDGLVSANLVKIHSGPGECNAGSWIEIALANDKPLSMWAFLVLPDQNLATITTVKRNNVNAIKDPNQDYMVGLRRTLDIVWQKNYLPTLSITATRYDYEETNYDEKGNLISKKILGSAWGSKVSSGKDLISNGNFDSCTTR